MALVLLVAGVGTAAAQSSTVSGTVRSTAGEPVIGAMVVVQGSQTVSMTDVEGRYSIEVPSSEAVLAFTLTGYTTVTRTVGTQSVIDVVMAEEAQSIDQVVVTALGILRKEKSLTYATQIVDGDELSRVKDANMMNSLAGKTSGVQINRSSAGVGGSAKVVIRGSRSLNGVGGPLYVIDGVPIGGSGDGGTNTYDSYGPWQGAHDTGDAISQLNPDDIESMNVLKGPSAAALYGTNAGNGVILITTKKGVAGRTSISVSSNTTFDQAVYGRPEFQNSYGGASTSWGAKLTGGKKYDYLDDYFKTGYTTINSISLSGGNDRAQTYFSYSNTLAKGIVKGNELNKHNITFRETASLLNDRLKLDANINMMYQKMDNLITPGGYYMNPLVGLYLFPRGGGVEGGESFEYYRDEYEIFDKTRNMMTQNWHNLTIENQNPFWLNQRTPSDSRSYRTLTNLSVSYKFSDDITLQARGKADFAANSFDKALYAGVFPGLAASGDGSNGYYGVSESFSLGLYADLLLSWQHQWEDWSASATVGASIADGHGRGMSVNSSVSGLRYPNLFNINNLNTPARPGASRWRGAQEQAVFFAGQVGWKDQIFLDLTARNDWTSTLAYTKHMKSGFFYPSVGLSWLIDQTVELPEWVTMGKVRATWAQVGNGLPGASSHPMHSVNFGPSLSFNTTAPYRDLRPEMSTSVEYGTEWRLFDNRLEFDFTYYLNNSRNQVFNQVVPTGGRYTNLWLQAGNMRNEGIEVTLAGTPVRTQEFSWRTGVNYAANRNKVVSLLGQVYDEKKEMWVEVMDFFRIGNQNPGNGFHMRAYAGGRMGDFYGYAFKRDGYDTDSKGNQTPNHTGAIQFNPETGLPLKEEQSRAKKLGNANPDFTIGWNNTFTWKGVQLYVLLDGRFGGQVVSMTEADLDHAGVSKRSGEDRDRGYVEFAGKKIEDVKGFYNLVGGRGGVTEHYVYSATNVRLRELSIGYSLPRRWMEKTGWIKGVDVSLIGRNLGFLYKKAPYDPDALMSTGTSLQGVDLYGLPGLRSFGFNVKLNF